MTVAAANVRNPRRPVHIPGGDVVMWPARANRNTSEPTRLGCRF